MRHLVVAAALAAMLPVHAAEVVDWNSGSAGTLGSIVVGLSGVGTAPVTPLLFTGALVSNTFGSGFFSGPVSLVEALEVYGRAAAPTNTYTITFSAPVIDVRLHFGSLASTLTFSQSVTKLSGQASFVVSGSTVTGAISNAGTPTDANGTIGLAGVLTSLSFTAIGLPGVGVADGIAMQVVASPVPEPAAALTLVLGVAGLLVRARRAYQRS